VLRASKVLGWPRRCKLAQKMQVGPCSPVRIQLERAAVGPTSGPTWRLSHLALLLLEVPPQRLSAALGLLLDLWGCKRYVRLFQTCDRFV
jgi:hypothetical protein